jgi:hypothetical protein
VQEGDEVFIRSQGRWGRVLSVSENQQSVRVRPESADGEPMDPVVIDADQVEPSRRLPSGCMAVRQVTVEELAEWLEGQTALRHDPYMQGRLAQMLLDWLKPGRGEGSRA